MDNLGNRLRELRTARGLAQEDIARMIGVSLSTVQRWENKGARPTRLGRKALEKLFARRQSGSARGTIEENRAHESGSAGEEESP